MSSSDNSSNSKFQGATNDFKEFQIAYKEYQITYIHVYVYIYIYMYIYIYIYIAQSGKRGPDPRIFELQKGAQKRNKKKTSRNNKIRNNENEL